jgi:hypothetical protein
MQEPAAVPSAGADADVGVAVAVAAFHAPERGSTHAILSDSLDYVDDGSG